MFVFQLNNFGAHPTTGECDINTQIETSHFSDQIQRTCVAGSYDMIQEDAVALQLFFFTIHHASRILAGEAQQKHELPLVNEQIKESIGKDYNAFSDLEKLSKDRIKLRLELQTSIEQMDSGQPIQYASESQAQHTRTSGRADSFGQFDKG
ncbi:MAG: hypothetical protein EZS28_011747 [Streblomastix strix]|uniref:Uncharacterized protein n=1 Tax=Streblomastix strix TaxID=222440 RepID=A0A5J4WEL7_9EUKA|nr:MAG: hypothetical protein EZS28_011747 [Streblomastix strix]